eukprot:scaffold34655_cov157-Amphora_coffeaeformis.AAC.2
MIRLFMVMVVWYGSVAAALVLASERKFRGWQKPEQIHQQLIMTNGRTTDWYSTTCTDTIQYCRASAKRTT